MASDPATARARFAALVRRIPGPVRIALAAAALALACLLAAHAALRRPAVEARLRARIAEALSDRLGDDVQLGPEVRVDWLLRVGFGPVVATDPADGVPRASVEHVTVRPRYLALLAGRVEPAAIRLSGVRVELVPGHRRARPATERAPGGAPARDAAAHGDAAAPSPTVQLRDVVVAVSAAGRSFEVGPVDGTVDRGAGGALAVELHRGRARAELRLARGKDGLDAHATLARFPAPRIPAALLRGAIAPVDGELAADLRVRAPADLARLDVAFDVRAERLTVEGPRLGADPIGPLRVHAAGDLSLDRATRAARLAEVRLELQDALRVTASGEARLGPGIPFSLALRADAVDYRALVDALPPALAPAAEAPRPRGTFDASVELSGALAHPGEWTIAGGLDLSRMREAARKDPPVALRRTFTYRPEVERGVPPSLRIGPEGAGFVPIAELPNHVIRAVTTSEDAGFFGHQGFDLDELKNAFAESAAKGRLVRGGSTITQQLAKNLYLSREKTLARKIREAITTIALESTVGKHRLLEIYLNIVEWGPGVYGIGPAARHYFGVDARALTPKQAAFLASIIPNPVRYHFMYRRGAITDGWEERVSDLLLKMREAGVLDDEGYATAVADPVVFRTTVVPAGG